MKPVMTVILMLGGIVMILGLVQVGEATMVPSCYDRCKYPPETEPCKWFVDPPECYPLYDPGWQCMSDGYLITCGGYCPENPC